jgi:hypothetical protein
VVVDGVDRLRPGSPVQARPAPGSMAGLDTRSASSGKGPKN